MEIKEVKIIPINSPDGRLLAYASAVVFGHLKLNSLRILAGQNGGYFVKPPSRKFADKDGNDHYMEFYHSVTKEFTAALFRAVSDAYKETLAGRPAPVAVETQAAPGTPPPDEDDVGF